jgi:hypothetical protein
MGDWDWRIWQQVGTIYMSPEDDSQGWVTGCSYATNEWFHFCFAYDHPSTTMSSYCNGNKVQTRSITFENTLDHRIFLASQQSTRWSGEIDEFYFFNRSLTAAEAESLASNRTTTDYKTRASCTTTSTPYIATCDDMPLGSTTAYTFNMKTEEDDTATLAGFRLEEVITTFNGSPIYFYYDRVLGDTSYDVCIYPSTANATINATIKYAMNDTNWDPRYYYLFNNVANNNTQYITLYNFDGLRVDFTVKDESQNELGDIIIKLQRLFSEGSSGEYRTVAMTKTNTQGEAFAYASVASDTTHITNFITSSVHRIQ